MKKIAGALAGLMLLASTSGAATFNFSRLSDFGDGLYVYWDTFQRLCTEIKLSTDYITTDQITNGEVKNQDIGDSEIQVGKLAPKTLLNSVISDEADIEFQKLEDLTAGNILVGSAANVPTQYPLTAINGDVALGWSYSTINSGAIVNADVNASAAIATTKVAFTAPTGGAAPYANVIGSMWGARYVTAPTGITATVADAWTDFDCDTYFSSVSGDTIPSGNVLAILNVVSNGARINVRPNGTAWVYNANTTPCIYNDFTLLGSASIILIPTDSDHIIEYYATTDDGGILLLGYIGPIPK